MVREAERLNYRAIAVTVDAPWLGNKLKYNFKLITTINKVLEKVMKEISSLSLHILNLKF